MLEWKVRTDLALYAAGHAPELRLEAIKSYVPKIQTSTNQWLNVIDRAFRLEEEDGHVVKLIRVAALGERVCSAYQNDEGFVLKNDMWVRVAQMRKSRRLSDRSLDGNADVWCGQLSTRLRSTMGVDGLKASPDFQTWTGIIATSCSVKMRHTYIMYVQSRTFKSYTHQINNPPKLVCGHTN